jgi:hypothetical protein
VCVCVDSTLLWPAQSLNDNDIDELYRIVCLITDHFLIHGPFNIQFVMIDDNERHRFLVIECNLRASRSLPFVCKASRTNLLALGARVLMHDLVSSSTVCNSQHLLSVVPSALATKLSLVGSAQSDRVAVKVPVFSFEQLASCDPMLGVQMLSTGEVACFGSSDIEAFSKAIVASGYPDPARIERIAVCFESTDTPLAAAVLRAIQRALAAGRTRIDVVQPQALQQQLYNERHQTLPQLLLYLPHKQWRYEQGRASRTRAVQRGVAVIANQHTAILYLECVACTPRCYVSVVDQIQYTMF